MCVLLGVASRATSIHHISLWAIEEAAAPKKERENLQLRIWRYRKGIES